MNGMQQINMTSILDKYLSLKEHLITEAQSFFSFIALDEEKMELTVTISKENLLAFANLLKNNQKFLFNQLIDVCGVDYLHYGCSEWTTFETTFTGFSRGVKSLQSCDTSHFSERFAVVYHVLSLIHNLRIRIKVFLNETALFLPTVTEIWPAANWFEREVFDLFGIIFDGHPDLRRILTDYGFRGHPFRKDFPLIGQVEVRYDATLGKVIYEPVDLEPRTLVPKVIRKDNRYA